MTKQELIAHARTWLGVPFQHQGRSRHGVDCAGFLEMLAEATGTLPDEYDAPRVYARRPNGELLQTVEKFCARAREAAPGVVVLIKWPYVSEPAHVALCTGSTIIHAYSRVGRVVENGYRGLWIRNTHSLWNFPGLAQ
jgi:cell wall-associated NlpC family hydrolase